MDLEPGELFKRFKLLWLPWTPIFCDSIVSMLIWSFVTDIFFLGYTNVLSLHSFLSGFGEFLSQDMERRGHNYLTIADYVP